MASFRKKLVALSAVFLSAIFCLYYCLSQSNSIIPSLDPRFMDCDERCHAYKKRLDRYCHRSLLRSQSKLDNQFSSAQDGNLPLSIADDYELVQVHIVVRHGDRSPNSADTIGSTVFYECGLTKGTDTYNWTKLKDFPHLQGLSYGSEQSHSVHHSVFPGTNSKRCGVGKLTKVGFYQLKALGHMLSKKYSKLLQSFSSHEALLRSMFVQSTDFSRTIRSAAAFLLGFLPDRREFRLSTVIHVSPGDDGFLQAPPPWITPTFKACKHYSVFHSNELKKSKYYTTEMSVYHPLLERLTSMFHITTNNKPLITRLFDSIATRGCHFKEDPLPCYKDKCIDYDFANKLFEFTDWSYSNRCTSSSSLVAMLPFLRHSVLEVMKGLVMGEKDSWKVVLSFTHDTTFTKLLYALGIHLPRWISYASRMTFELWRYKGQSAASTESFYVRVLFNGSPLTHRLTAWKENEDPAHVEILPYVVWERFVTTGLFRDTESYDRACSTV